MNTSVTEKKSSVLHQIPYVNISRQHAPLKDLLLKAIGRIIDHGQFILGDEVGEFEKRFAAYCGVRHAVAVNSGTDALILALRTLNIGPGDEVITTPNSFISTAACIAMVGARPVFADVRGDYNIDPDKIENAITPETKAILPVHLTGRPAEMDAIQGIASAHGLAVVEDCAQSVGAEYHGRRVGSLGILGCFSLHPLKTLNACGDGGVITTNDESFYRRLLLLRNLGLETRENCVVWSSNSRLDTFQAATLRVKMDCFESWTEKRRRNAVFYQKTLADIPEIRTPIDRPYEKAVYHTFVIQAGKRDPLKTFLAENGIGTSIHYPIPIHLQTVSQPMGYGPGSFPVAEAQAKKILSLPVYPELTLQDLEYITKKIREFYNH